MYSGSAFGISAPGVVQQGEIVEASGHVGVFRPQGLFQNGEGASVQRLRLGVAALGAINLGQVVEASGDLRTLRPRAFSRMAKERLYSGSASA